ncbi:FAD-dependent oxidoreductase [Actinoplanes auranticolor]|uniref:Hydroxylase n=1 Tax=Actinoplanes auranticolor TaxID=47988 RepID=A0A919SFX5_9ACTN|nr:FAD-dependent monooxygenase [Actinoplanes auranticolor]GIM71677.1 hydroxylase [Actinoplanes auranticolor]
MTESMVSRYEKLVHAGPPGDVPVLFDTACVLGGSIAGLMAARVLSDRARRVVVIEPDDTSAETGSRPGVPQDQQVHTLLPVGQRWLERWVPGTTRQAQDRGASLVADQGTTVINGVPQAPDGEGHHLLAVGRPLLEALLRNRITSLPNVSVLRGHATGLQYRDDAVSGVRYDAGAGGGQGGRSEGVLDADFVVDAMGRSSRLSNWLKGSGYDQPRIERLEAPVNYATARFARPAKVADLETPGALALFTPEYPSSGVSVAAVQPIEGRQWIVMLMGYGDSRPGRTIGEFREICTKLPPVFATATAGAVIGDVMTYHQAESRRRDFTGAVRFPARLVSVGDAVASFNPIYGQGLSSAALHASCLASYLADGPDLGTAAREFFRLQQVVVDAAWAVSAGGDAARLDALHGTEVPDDVRQQRWAMEQIAAATLVDGDVTRAFNSVSYMLRHPATLADPALLAKAVAANGTAAPVAG